MFRKKMMAVIAVAVFGVTMYGASGCASAHEGHDHAEASGTAVTAEAAKKGEVCPVSGEQIEQPGKFTYTYQAKVYNLCCADCLDAFKKDPKAYIAKINRAAAKNTQEPTEHEGHDHGHD